MSDKNYNEIMQYVDALMKKTGETKKEQSTQVVRQITDPFPAVMRMNRDKDIYNTTTVTSNSGATGTQGADFRSIADFVNKGAENLNEQRLLDKLLADRNPGQKKVIDVASMFDTKDRTGAALAQQTNPGSVPLIDSHEENVGPYLAEQAAKTIIGAPTENRGFKNKKAQKVSQFLWEMLSPYTPYGIYKNLDALGSAMLKAPKKLDDYFRGE